MQRQDKAKIQPLNEPYFISVYMKKKMSRSRNTIY
ncbi:unnamed protein product, partial [Larinioides sclopetarius]